jgi:hypothetical protein
MAFNINPGGETFVYQCDKCGAEARQPSIVKCPVCDKRLCENCSRWNFCGEHLMLLNPAEQKRVQKLDKLQRAGFNPFGFIFPALLGFVLFFVFFFIDGLWWVGLICFFVFPLSGLIYQFTGKRGKAKKATFELEKIGYKYRNQPMPITQPNDFTQLGGSSIKSNSLTSNSQAPSSTCPNCGAVLSGETNYCSYCGGKL